MFDKTYTKLLGQRILQLCKILPERVIPILLESECLPRVWGVPGHQISGAGIASCPHGRWELHSGSLDELCVLLTAQPSFQPPGFIFKERNKKEN